MIARMMNALHALLASFTDSMSTEHSALKGSRLAPSRLNRRVTAQLR